jgi:hypothetical protein
MRKADQWSGILLFIFSALIFWGAIPMPYGTLHNPGPGFFPLWLGIILGAMAIGLILKVTWQKEGAKMLREILEEKIRLGKVLSILIALFLYGYLLDPLGFPIVTSIFMVFRFIDPLPWKSVIAWALIGCMRTYLIFEVWMKLRLPKGFLGI